MFRELPGDYRAFVMVGCSVGLDLRIVPTRKDTHAKHGGYKLRPIRDVKLHKIQNMRRRKAGNPKWVLLGITFEEDDIPVRKNVLLPFET